MKKFMIALLCAFLALPAFSQTVGSLPSPGYTSVTATKMVDANGQPLASGTATFRVTDANAHPLSVQMSVGGQVITRPVSVAVTNGAFSVLVPDVSMTSPANPCIQMSISDNATGSVVWQASCLQPTGNFLNLDNYIAISKPITLQPGQSVQGDLSVQGNFSTSGNFNPGAITTGPLVASTINAQTTTSLNTNGLINPLFYSGSDIGAQVNAAMAALPSNGGTVRIPDGVYNFATTIRITQPNVHLSCGRGTTLNYTGSTDAIAFIDVVAPGAAAWQLDGENGCVLNGSGATSGANGVRIFPSNSMGVRQMKIIGFSGGAGIRLDGANSVQIHDNVIQGNLYGIYTVSAPYQQGGNYAYSGPCCGFAPNAIHVHDNEIAANGWGYYSANGNVTATRGLGNVIRDNVFEANTSGDLRLGWDAHTVVEGNYFESTGAGSSIAAGVGSDNVYDITIKDNYFTIANTQRSEIEIGYGLGFTISGNYEEGPSGASSGCMVNVVPGPNGGANNIVATNAFELIAEARSGTPTTNQFCVNGSPSTTPGTYRFQSNVTMPGTLNVTGEAILNSSMGSGYPSTSQIIGVIGPLTIWAGSAAPGGTCPTNLATIWFSPAGMSVCQSGYWVAK